MSWGIARSSAAHMWGFHTSNRLWSPLALAVAQQTYERTVHLLREPTQYGQRINGRSIVDGKHCGLSLSMQFKRRKRSRQISSNLALSVRFVKSNNLPMSGVTERASS